MVIVGAGRPGDEPGRNMTATSSFGLNGNFLRTGVTGPLTPMSKLTGLIYLTAFT